MSVGSGDIVTVPNKLISDMVIYNKSREDANATGDRLSVVRSRLMVSFQLAVSTDIIHRCVGSMTGQTDPHTWKGRTVRNVANNVALLPFISSSLSSHHPVLFVSMCPGLTATALTAGAGRLQGISIATVCYFPCSKFCY